MKEHGILMSAPMVRAYLAGLKTQTRRTRGLDVINRYPDKCRLIGTGVLEKGYGYKGYIGKFGAFFEEPKHLWISKDKPSRVFIPAPYGNIGDRLYFKETHAIGTEESVVYRADYLDGGEGADSVVNMKTGDLTPLIWKPSIFMKRKYARIVTPVVRVRVERLKDITGSDCFFEGLGESYRTGIRPEQWQLEQRQLYFDLWDHLNGKKLPVEKNPYVWVYEFLKPSDLALLKKQEESHVASV